VGERERARTALRLAGFPAGAPLVRASSNANEAWLGPDFVLRVNARGDVGRLQREARIAAGLPPEALYPGVLACDSDGEIEWIIVRRQKGVDLSRAWPELGAAPRERATRELAAALRALHGVTAPELPEDDELDAPHTLPLERLLGLLERVRNHGVDAKLLDELGQLIRASWTAFDQTNMGLVHGDPHLENVLWDGQHVSAVLDLEWSRRSWLEVDLETLLSFCDHPSLFVSADYEALARAADYASVPRWLREAYPAWFAHPRSRDRLTLLHVSRTLGLLHDSARAEIRVAQLRAVLDGSCRILA
jgi:aminoglycoside phosphotransferase (APT) family kinase protein